MSQPHRADIDLVAVIWGDDQGVVSLKHQQWLFYNWGRSSGHHVNTEAELIVEVGIEDRDFELLGVGRSGTSNWGEVVELLTHPRFPLLKRINEGRPT